MYTLYKQTTPIKDNDGNIVGYNTIPVQVADDFFILYGLKFDWKNKTVSRKGDTYYLDTLTSDDMQKIPSPEEWLATYGNTIKTIYYAEGEDLVNNPSDNPRNIKQRIYYNSQRIKKYDIRYSWDINDNISMESSVAPNKEGAINYKLTILNADPTVEGATMELMYPEDTFIPVNDLIRTLQQGFSTYIVDGFQKDGKVLGDFYISDNTTIKAMWNIKALDAKVTMVWDGQRDDKTYTYAIGNAGHTYAFDADDYLQRYARKKDSSWRANAYVGTMIEYLGDMYESPWETYLENNVAIDVHCEKRPIPLRLVREDGSEIAATTATYDAQTNLAALAPGYARYTIGSGDSQRTVDNISFAIGQEILDKEYYGLYFDDDGTLTITAHSA